ncbi:MAG: hypothetical protein GXP15_03775 [Gammaproteobacteria bacterium]|nr:hypothetical protein [Gammaproteobacteria bacterium]
MSVSATLQTKARAVVGVLTLSCILVQAAHTQEGAGPAMGKIVDLGEQRFQIGEIVIDRKAREFSVPGRILHLSDALEYLAVSKGGMKDYESLLELTTTPRDFNLACILIGFDDTETVKPRYQFDEFEVQGPPVVLTLSWQEDGKTQSVSAANAMKAGEETFDNNDWVYIGSSTSADGQQFLAERGGTLIGFVHDPYSIIDHKTGGGIGAYGLITGNESLLPAEGSAIRLTVGFAR